MAASGAVPFINPSTKSMESPSSPQAAWALESSLSTPTVPHSRMLSHSGSGKALERVREASPTSSYRAPSPSSSYRDVRPFSPPPSAEHTFDARVSSHPTPSIEEHASAPGGSPFFQVSSPMDQVETAEWQQVERFLDMLVSSKSQGSARNVEQLATAFARHLTVIRQREELRIHSIRQLQTNRKEEEDNEDELIRLRQELDNHINTQAEVANGRVFELESELKASQQETEKAVMAKEALNHAMDMEFAKAQKEREDILSMLHNADDQKDAVQRLNSSERERDAARLELLEAELSLARNKVKALEEQVVTAKKELDMSEKGRKEALLAASSGREECLKLQKEVQEVTLKSTKLDKERKVYETAARKAAGELVNLRLRASSPMAASLDIKDNMARSNNSLPNVSLASVQEMAQKYASMGNNLDISVGAQSGSDKATTASDSRDSKSSDKRTITPVESPNLDKPVLPARSTSPDMTSSDSDSNQNSSSNSPDNTLSAVPPLQEFKGEMVMRAALELAAIARGKAEKALSMRAEESKEAEKIEWTRVQDDVDRMRTVDALADSMPRVSPSSSPRPVQPEWQPQPQSAGGVFGGHPVLANSGMASPAVLQRHPSPPRQSSDANRPFAALAGAPGGSRSMSNLTPARSPTRPTPHGLQDSRSPGPMRQSRAPPGSTATGPQRQQQQQQQFPQRMAGQVGGQRTMPGRR